MTQEEQESADRMAEDILPDALLAFAWLKRADDAQRMHLLSTLVRHTIDAWGLKPRASHRQIAREALTKSLTNNRFHKIQAELGETQTIELSFWIAERLRK